MTGRYQSLSFLVLLLPSFPCLCDPIVCLRRSVVYVSILNSQPQSNASHAEFDRTNAHPVRCTKRHNPLTPETISSEHEWSQLELASFSVLTKRAEPWGERETRAGSVASVDSEWLPESF